MVCWCDWICAFFLCQVVDGFFVKRVQDVRESAAYLTVMTRYLTKLYQVTHAQNSLVQKFQSSLQLIYGVKENICKSLNCEACFTLLILFNLIIFQNRTLMCRSRELEGDGGSDEEERESPSCSLISFAEFNHGAVKNKVSVRTITKTARPLFFKWSVSVDI